MREAALRVYASLGANDEDIRQRVIDSSPNLMGTIVASLSSGSQQVQFAALRCLHSLSRSVHTLRTTLQVIIQIACIIFTNLCIK